MSNNNIFLELFPFSIVLNRSLEITETGPSLLKIAGNCTHKLFTELFTIQRPFLEEVSFNVLKDMPKEAIFLQHSESGLLLRGQFRQVSSANELTFLGSIWVTNFEYLKKYKLTTSDFSIHDPTFDYLHVLKQAEIHRKELHELISTIDEQSAKIKKTNAEIVKTKGYLESIFNEMTDVVWSVTVPGYKILFITPSVEPLLEIPVDYCIKTSTWWKQLFPTEERHIISQIFKALKTKGEYNITHKITTLSGQTKWIKNKGKFIYDEYKKPIRLDVTIVNRTQQHLDKEALDHELKLREALTEIASTYINLDPKDVSNTIFTSLKKMGLFVNADRAYIFDYNFTNGTTSNTYEWCNNNVSSEINNLQDIPISYFPQWIEEHKKGQPFYIPNVGKLNDEKDRELKQILESQNIKSLITIPMLDGKELVGFVGFDSVIQHYDYSDREKKLLFLFGQMLINIKNRQKWDYQLRLQEEKYRNIIANMNLGLLEVDLEDTIIYANQSFCEMSAYTLSELKGKKAAELFVPEKHQAVIKEKAQKRKESVSDGYEIEIRDKNGVTHYWLISGAPNYNDKGQFIGSIGIHLDITDQKNLERELAKAKLSAEAAAKAKELFLANMSHEIRTPLNVITGMIRQLAKENLSDHQHFYVKQAESSAKHLLTILNNVLDIAKIESGDMEIVKTPFSPGALAHNVHSIMYSQVKDKNLDFDLVINPEVKQVLRGDEIRLRQVLINLIGNAIKFTDKGFITLKLDALNTTTEQQIIRFEVSDSGIGMSPEFVNRIFDKFSQEQNKANRRYEGTGLGMAISHDLVKLMGGDLKVKSKKDEGTTFSFDLILSIEDSKNLIVQNSVIKKGAFLGKRILLAEDNEMNRFIAIQHLEFLGFEITEAENGLIATELVKTGAFDLILMDIQMPVMDGVEATVFIRKELKNTTPIIALTANAFKHDINLYLKKGMNDFITKPYDEQDFFLKIEYVLRQNEQQVNDKKREDSIIHSKEATEEAAPFFDLTELRKVSRGNEAFVKKMTDLFITLAKEHTAILSDALTREDLDTIKKIAHKMKPSIAQMGIEALKPTIAKTEVYDLNVGNWEELKALVNHINHILLKVIIQLENIR